VAAQRGGGSGVSTKTDFWTPPEVRRNTQQLQPQERTFVWHAGHLEQQKVEEIETNIQRHTKHLMEMIQSLPTMGSNGSDSQVATSNTNIALPLIEEILQHEQMILRLCNEYKRLTGEEYCSLPQPYCDDSSTVIRI
jgi:hypothetical protein